MADDADGGPPPLVYDDPSPQVDPQQEGLEGAGPRVRLLQYLPA